MEFPLGYSLQEGKGSFIISSKYVGLENFGNYFMTREKVPEGEVTQVGENSKEGKK